MVKEKTLWLIVGWPYSDWRVPDRPHANSKDPSAVSDSDRGEDSLGDGVRLLHRIRRLSEKMACTM